MSRSRPIGARAIALVLRLGVRRWTNRIAAAFRKRSKPGAPAAKGPRAPTPRKQAVTLGVALLGLAFLLPTAVFQSGRLVRRVLSAVDAVELVPMRVYQELRWDRDLSGALRGGSISQDKRAQLVSNIEEQLREADVFATASGDRRARAEAIVERYLGRGLAGFASDGPVPLVDYDRLSWPTGELAARTTSILGGLLSCVFALVVLTSLGAGNQDLGRIEWSFEWLWSLPGSTRALLWAKLVEHTLLSPLLWFTAFPLLLAAGMIRSSFWLALGFAGAGSIYLAVLCGAGRLICETWLRLRFTRLKNLQAGFTLAGSVAFLLVLWLSNSPIEPRSALLALERLHLDWAPFGWPAGLLGERLPWMLLLAMLAMAIATAALSVELCARWLAGGLIGSSHAYASSAPRRALAPAASGAWPRGALGKDLRLLLRDRSFFVQTLVIPVVAVGVQLALNEGLMRAVVGNFHHAAMFAFGLGSYALIFSAASVLSVEGPALWMLYACPQPLERVLRSKAIMWASIASVYALAGLGAALWFAGEFSFDHALVCAVALVGVPIHAFIAAGLGALGTDPLEIEAQRRVSPTTLYFYMLLASMFAYAIYAPSIWHKCVQVVLSTLLAFALWQKLRDRVPYLLDPTEAPPARLSFAEGALTTMAFFTAQGLFAWLLAEAHLSMGAITLASFALAGLTVTLGSVLLLRRAQVRDLLGTIGLRRPLELPSASVRANVALGLAGGLAAACISIAYLALLRQLPLSIDWKQQLESSPLADLGLPLLAALAVVCAPLFEEYLFRGLVFRGMQRSLGSGLAVLGSAALFAIVHPPISAIPVFCMGAIAALVFRRGGLLLGPICVHAVYNACVLGFQLWARSQG